VLDVPLEEGIRAASPSLRGIEGEHNYHDFLRGYWQGFNKAGLPPCEKKILN
jgi:hypothetical protein